MGKILKTIDYDTVEMFRAGGPALLKAQLFLSRAGEQIEKMYIFSATFGRNKYMK